MELGKTIAKLRRERGLTQEQLGQALCVSGQAVSKWEKGGTPDAEMLPAIADRLGVTIDTLFGRADEPTENMTAALLRWLGTFPAERRMMELFRLLCPSFQRPYHMDDQLFFTLMDAVEPLPIKSCYTSSLVGDREETMWLRSLIQIDSGLQLGVPSVDCPFFLLMPEPEGGFEANFADNEAYRALFRALAAPHALEILRVLYKQKQSYYSVHAISKLSGIDADEVRDAVRALTDCSILRETEIETGEELMNAYVIHDTGALAPFLLLSRWLMDAHDAFFYAWQMRTRPLLKKEDKHEK